MSASPSRWEVGVVAAHEPELRRLIDELSDVLGAAYGSTGRSSFDPDGDDRAATFVLARFGGDAVACGALRPLDERIGEIKRMYSTRAGGGRRVHELLETVAGRLGFAELWLETRRANEGAVAFYHRLGYAERAPYGRYVGRPEAICLAKPVTPAR